MLLIVQLKNKEVVSVTQGNYISLIANSKEASDRKKIFEAVYKTYDDHKNTYATIYNNVLQDNKANAKARNYESVLESFLYDNNIPTSVFTNLIDVAGNNNKALKKYIKLSQDNIDCFYHTPNKTLICVAHISDHQQNKIHNRETYKDYYCNAQFNITFSTKNFEFGKAVIYNDYEKFINKIVYAIKSI